MLRIKIVSRSLNKILLNVYILFVFYIVSRLTLFWTGITPCWRQSKTLLTIDERGSKLARNSVFEMSIENSVSDDV